jgi:hypothetical protein
VAQRDRFCAPKKGLALRIEAKWTERIPNGELLGTPIRKISEVFRTLYKTFPSPTVSLHPMEGSCVVTEMVTVHATPACGRES